jgi:hypothetical protein
MAKYIPLSLLAFFFLSAFTACQQHSAEGIPLSKDKQWLHSSLKKITDILVYDITNPPLASRSYAYPCIAAYYAYMPFAENNKAITPELNEWHYEQIAVDTSTVDGEFSALSALLETSKNHIYSQDQLQNWIDSLYSYYMQRLPTETYEQSLSYSKAVAKQLKKYADSDGLREIRTMSKYKFSKAEKGNWIPTPPNYMDPIEPNWDELRPFCLDSAEQFKPEPPTAFSTNKESPFYKEVKEVYEVGNQLTEEERAIASFWDCNPYVVLHQGHFMQPVKKITPGGHWMGITRLACIKDSASFEKSLKAYAYTSIALADGFISCWDEKYRSNYIRPETVINIYFDDSWTPTLQTPPFPEYTSGHSVISTAAARALTHIFGADFSFEDTVENEFGLPTRTYDSFLQASNEAAISRLYGGIHFRPAIENGVKQGHLVADEVLKTLTN